jgi:exopolysaccharide biosynthesis protein
MRFFFTILIIILVSNYSHAQQKLQWHKQKVAPGIRHWSLHTKQFFNSEQNINVLILRKRSNISIGFEEDSLKHTSQFGKENQALAAVNAGFFDMKNGGAVSYLKVDNQIINKEKTDTALDPKHRETIEGAFIITDNQKIIIDSVRHESIYDTNESFNSVLVTGPLLLLDGKKQDLGDNAFNNNRHPRTCACLLQNNRLLLITVDGRAEEAQGMSLPELTNFLLQLKCKDAINFDGGGSTTMWLHNEPENGVVNMPSDNKVYDRYGERKVASVILIKK